VLGPDPYTSPVEMANAYATFAADGKYVPMHIIKLVKGVTGKTRWSDAEMQKGKVVIDPEMARWINFALQKVVRTGTGKRPSDTPSKSPSITFVSGDQPDGQGVGLSVDPEPDRQPANSKRPMT
jgi:membrane carboxypeptidase/penicillin-binding protein